MARRACTRGGPTALRGLMAVEVRRIVLADLVHDEVGPAYRLARQTGLLGHGRGQWRPEWRLQGTGRRRVGAGRFQCRQQRFEHCSRSAERMACRKAWLRASRIDPSVRHCLQVDAREPSGQPLVAIPGARHTASAA
jgi:hypothetical protein